MKSLLTVVTLVLSLIVMQALAFADLPEPKGKPENPNVAAGRKAIEANDFKAAVGHLTKAVQDLPNDADAQSMLGYSYRKLGTFDKSMEHYQKALDRFESSVRARIFGGALPRHESARERRKATPGLEKRLPVLRQMRGVRRPEGGHRE